MQCSVSTRAGSRDWAHLWLGTVTAGIGTAAPSKNKFIEELDSVVKPHTESCSLPFCTSNTRFSNVDHRKEFHSEVGHC